MSAVRTLDVAHILLVVGLLLIPGTGLLVALAPPGRVSIPAAPALALALGFAAIAIDGYALALLHVLNRTSAVVVYGLMCLAAWALGARRLGDHVRGWRRKAAAARWPLLIGAATMCAFLLVRLTYAPATNMAPTTLRYWADGVEVADAGRIPDSVLHWNVEVSPATSKAALNSFDAVVTLVMGRAPLPQLGALLLVLSVGLAFAVWGFLWAVGLRWTAPAGVLWLLGNVVAGQQELSRDLATMLAENWGRLLLFVAATLAVGAIARASTPVPEATGEETRTWSFREVRPETLLAGSLFGVSAATHLVPTAVGFALCGAYAIGRIALDRTVVRVLLPAAVGTAAALVVGGSLLLLASGDLGFKGAADAAGYDQIRGEFGLPPTWDPTTYITRGDFTQEAAEPYGAGDVVRAFETHAIYELAGKSPASTAAHAAPFLAAVLGAGVMLAVGNHELRVLSVTTLAYAAVLVAVGIGFAIHYDTFALARFGERRLMDYWGLPFVLLGAGGIEALLRRAPPGHPWRRPRPVVAAALTVAVAVVLLPQDTALRERILNRERDLEPLAWIAEHVPCEGRILADRRTLATFELFTGHAGVLEGMGPHIRPDVLLVAIRELFAARSFFLAPLDGEAYLRGRGVAAVVVTGPDRGLAGWWRVAPIGPKVERRSLSRAPFLELAFSSPRVTIFRVKDFNPNPELPHVEGQPGFRCTAAP